MSKRIIGFTGSLGSGCTTSATYLAGKGYTPISISSQILNPLAVKFGKPFNTREEKQIFGNYARENLRAELKECFLSAVNNAGDKVVVECFRNPIEIEFLRDEYPHFYLIALFAPKVLREQRKPEKDFEVLDQRDAGEDNKLGQQVRKCVTNADIVIDNSQQWATIENSKEFFEKLDDFIRLLEEPWRSPTEKEINMHLAYSVSLRSKCIQRQVGAVITDENYKVLSTGYNDVPQNSDTCYDLYSECYRKIKQTKDLSGLNDVKYCPGCGAKLAIQYGLLEKYLDKEIVCPNCKLDLLKIFAQGKGLDYCRSLHAEENAILSNPYTADHFYKKSKPMRLFTTTFPCMLCAKKIANSGIKLLIFVEPYPVVEAIDVLRDNDVSTEAFEGVKSLKFNWIFRKRGKYIKDHAFKRRQDLIKLTKGGL